MICITRITIIGAYDCTPTPEVVFILLNETLFCDYRSDLLRRVHATLRHLNLQWPAQLSLTFYIVFIRDSRKNFGISGI